MEIFNPMTPLRPCKPQLRTAFFISQLIQLRIEVLWVLATALPISPHNAQGPGWAYLWWGGLPMRTVSLGRQQVPVQALTSTSIPLNQNSANFPLCQHLCEFFFFPTSASNFQGFASRVPALEGIGLFLSPSPAQQEYARLLWESPYCALLPGLNCGSHSVDTQSVVNAAYPLIPLELETSGSFLVSAHGIFTSSGRHRVSRLSRSPPLEGSLVRKESQIW